MADLHCSCHKVPEQWLDIVLLGGTTIVRGCYYNEGGFTLYYNTKFWWILWVEDHPSECQDTRCCRKMISIIHLLCQYL